MQVVDFNPLALEPSTTAMEAMPNSVVSDRSVDVATYHLFLLFGFPSSTVKETAHFFELVDTFVLLKPSRGLAGWCLE